MEKVLSNLNNFYSYLKELYFIVTQIIGLVVKHYWISLILLILILSTNFVKYLTYTRPENTIEKFYHDIDFQQHESAWSLINNNFKRKWPNAFKEFTDGYSPSSSHNIINIEYVTRTKDVSRFQAYDEFVADKVHFLVEFNVIERFRAIDLIDTAKMTIKPSQQRNFYFLQLRYGDSILAEFMSQCKQNPNYQKSLMKHQIKMFTLVRDSDQNFFNFYLYQNWKISDISNYSEGIILDNCQRL